MDTPLLLGIEIGGTKLQVALGHGDGRILALERRPADPAGGAHGIWRQITSAIEPLCAQLGLVRPVISAAGVGFGGPVDAERGRVVRSHQVSGWDDAPLADWVRRDLSIAVAVVQNDSDTAALAEARFGAGAGHSPLLYVNSGSGVGGGLIVGNCIYRGGSGIGAVEIGHLRVFPEEHLMGGVPGFVAAGEQAQLGMAPVLEQVASGWAIGRAGALYVEASVRHRAPGGPALVALSGGDPARVTAQVVAAAAELGDEEALRILDEATTAMAQGLAHALTLMAPRRVVLGGGVSLIPTTLWLDPIREKLARAVFGPFQGTYDVVPAALGEEVVVQGALALARDAWDSATGPVGADSRRLVGQ